jgi:phage terminase Nu1 subunit (DNA packaging protein)
LLLQEAEVAQRVFVQEVEVQEVIVTVRLERQQAVAVPLKQLYHVPLEITQLP